MAAGSFPPPRSHDETACEPGEAGSHRNLEKRERDRDGGRREFFHRRGRLIRSYELLNDAEQVVRVSVVRVDARGLAQKDLGGLELVAAHRQLAQEPVGRGAAGVTTEAVAQVALGLDVAPQGQERAGEEEPDMKVVGVIVECVGADGHHAGELPAAVELQGRSHHARAVHASP